MNNKKAQIWGVDLMIAAIIFSIGIMIFYIYLINFSTDSKDDFQRLSYEARLISNSILSEGTPDSWDIYNVQKIGILTGNKIDDEKVESFYNLAQNNYTKTKKLFNTRYDYYFFINEPLEISSGQISGIGKSDFNEDKINKSRNFVKITRVTIYKNKPVNAYIYIWE
jgi:hypothetical protein